MNRALQQFEINLQSANQLGVIYLAFADKVTSAIRLDELLRAQLVSVVSAVDCYVHDLVRIGMVKCFLATGGEPNAYLNFEVSLGLAKRLVLEGTESVRLALIEEEIRRLHGYKTFQSPRNISQALSLVGIGSVWEKVGRILGMPALDVSTRLSVIIDRRNRIAHESDIDPALGIGAKYPIDYAMVAQAVDFLSRLVGAIHSIALAEVTF